MTQAPQGRQRSSTILPAITRVFRTSRAAASVATVLPPLRGLNSFRFLTRGRRAWRRSDPGLYAVTPSGGLYCGSPAHRTDQGSSDEMMAWASGAKSQSHRTDQGSSDCL